MILSTKWIFVAMVWLSGHSIDNAPDFQKAAAVPNKTECVSLQSDFVRHVKERDDSAHVGTICISQDNFKAGNISDKTTIVLTR
jgi:hypothetical protein